jgi:hypothetical protein
VGNRIVVTAIALVLGLATAWAVAGLAQTISGNHVVDGYRLGRESTCEPATNSVCQVSARVAIQTLMAKAPDAVVVRQGIADPVCRDEQVQCAFTGLSQPFFVVFDLADGSRRVIGMMCEGEVMQDGRVVSEPQCTHDDFLGLRAGASTGS